MKTCVICKLEKQISEFYKDSTTVDGLATCCKPCKKDVKRRYNEKNRKKIKEYNAKYKSEHKEELKQKVWSKAYQKKRAIEDPLFRFQLKLRSLIRKALTRRKFKKTSSSKQLLGAELEVVKAHLESTWLVRYGTPYNDEPVHIDHVIPCSAAKSRAALLALQHYTNLQYLTPEDNLKKSDKIVF